MQLMESIAESLTNVKSFTAAQMNRSCYEEEATVKINIKN